MRLLVTGGAGMLGQAVAAAATRLGHDVVALSRAELDVTDADHVRRVVAAAEPRAVVNCAAWTDVDGAETAEAAATAVNGEGAGNVARAAAESGARIVHVSTDYVFDGTKREPWLESDAVNPIGAYGRSKLVGEEQVAAATDEHAIVRTAWLFGAGGRNFVDTMLALGEERDEVSVVTDQVGSPTWTVHLAEGLGEVAEGGGGLGGLHAAGGGAGSGGWPSAAATWGSCTRRAAGPARGTSWRSRSSTAPACAAASCRPRRTASRGPRGVPRTRSWGPSATRRRCCRPGRTGWRPT